MGDRVPVRAVAPLSQNTLIYILAHRGTGNGSGEIPNGRR